jgi:diadenylate cyclase
MVIQNSRSIAAGCFLPLSEQQDIKKTFGTRHRASLGMSEQSDAVILVVSEETGAISIAFDGKLYYDLSPTEVTQKLQDFFEHGVRSKESEQKTDIKSSLNARLSSSIGISINAEKDIPLGH